MTDQPAALREARQYFAGQGLPFPYIPPELERQLRKLGPETFGTRSDTSDVFDFARFGKEAGTTAVPDYLMLGYQGRGTNSYAIHYYLVHDGLALFLQLSWGGAYTEQTAARQDIAAAFAQAERLIKAAGAARREGRLKDNEKLIVMVSDFTGSNWIKIDGLMPEMAFITSSGWHLDDNATLTNALASLQNGESHKSG